MHNPFETSLAVLDHYCYTSRTAKIEVHNTREILKITDVIGTIKGALEPGMLHEFKISALSLWPFGPLW